MKLKSFLIITTILLCSQLLVNCKKDDPMPCPEECSGTSLTSGFKQNLVGRWVFFKQKFHYMAWDGPGTQPYWTYSWRDSTSYDPSYEIEIAANGLIQFIENDSVVLERLLKTDYEIEYQDNSDPFNGIGAVSGDFVCLSEVLEDQSTFFSSRFYHIDTCTFAGEPVSLKGELGTDNPSLGPGYYYRKH